MVPGTHPDPEEVAAMVAAVAVLHEERRRGVAHPPPAGASERLDAWVQAARLSERGAVLTRGSWRLAGRIGRRRRA